jgi:hypothetical protein
MLLSVRRVGAAVLGVAILFGSLNGQAQAQRVSMMGAFNPGIAPARGLAGLATASALSNGGTGFGALGFGAPAFGAFGFGPGTLGFGNLAASYAAGNLLGGYGSLLNSAYGGYGLNGGSGYGLYGGYYTQWMQNPYEGYLSGAASVTNANAQYQVTINQARLLRQEAIRSSFQTRRAAIEQAEYDRAHMPDPEKIRQQQLARELDRARISPPLTEVWSGKSLNVLLRNAIARQSQGGRGPTVPVSEEILRSINPTAGDTRDNIGLLKDGGNLQWPQALQVEAFKETREDLSRRMKQAVQTVTAGNKSPDESTLADMQADLKRLNEIVDASVNVLSPDQYIEAKRYLNQVGNAVTALRDRNVSNYLSGNWLPRGKTVAELVKYMGDRGLWFAPAAPGDEPAYLALYHALAAFDAGMPRIATTGGSGREGGSVDK